MVNRRLDAKAFGLMAALLVISGAVLLWGFVEEGGRTTTSATKESRCRIPTASWVAEGAPTTQNKSTFAGNAHTEQGRQATHILSPTPPARSAAISQSPK
jgi:hypothetical protein